MAINETARAEVILNGQKANATLKELENSAKALNAELRKMAPNADGFTKKAADYQVLKGRITELKQEIGGTQSALSKMGDVANKYFQLFTVIGVAITGVVLAIKGLVTTAADLSDSLSNIRKTTGLTADEVNRLNKELKKIDTRTSREDLRQMAVVAGQLGVASKDLVPFIESMDKLNVALGNEITGGAEQVAKSVGTLRNVLIDFKTTNISEDIMLLGNAINSLGLSGFATAPVIIDFASRIGGIGIPLGLTTGQVLGLSATLQELAIKTEKGGTAVGRILQKMTTNTSEFARVAGVPVKEFTELVNNDLFGAFVKTIEGSKRTGASATLLAELIKDLEIAGMGASEVFAKLSNNLPMLGEKVSMMDTDLKTSSGIMEIYKEKNENLAATLAKLGKEWHSLIASPAIISFLTRMVEKTVSLVAWLKVLPTTIKENAVALTVMTGALLIWIAGATRNLQITIANNLLLKEGILLKIKDEIVLGFLIIKERIYTLVKSEGTIATKIATVAQWAWNAALSANPIGLVIAGVTALIAAIRLYDSNNRTAVLNEQVKHSSMKRMESVNKLLASSYDAVNAQVRKLSELSSREKIDLENKIAGTIKLAEAELLLMEVRAKKVRDDNTKATLLQKTGNLVASAGMPGGFANTSMLNEVDAFKNGSSAAKELDEGISNLRQNLSKLKEVQVELVAITKAESQADLILGKTAGELEQKLSKLMIARKNSVAGSEDFLRIQVKIKDVQTELAKFSPEELTQSEKDRAAKEALKSSYEKLGDEIKLYIELLREQVITSPVLAEITAKKIAQLEKEKKVIEDLVKLEIERASYNNAAPISRMTSLGADGYHAVEDSKKRKDKIDGVERNQPGEMGWEKTEQTDTQIWAEKADKVLAYANFTKDTLGEMFNTLSNNEDRQLDKDEYNNQKKQSNLKARLNAGIITQKQYDAAVLKMDTELSAKRRKIEHDQAVRNKAIAVVQAGINVAQGVTAALAGMPPASYVMAILTGVLGAIQVAAILGAEVPQAARGRYNVTGMDDHRLYHNVPWVGNATTGLYASPTLISEAGPEYVIDAKTTRNLQVNYPGVIDAINYARVPQFATGNYPQNSPSASAIKQSQGNFEQGLLSALTEFNAHARQGIRTFVVYDDVRNAANTVNEIENNVKIG